jgi:hypothetical protein
MNTIVFVILLNYQFMLFPRLQTLLILYFCLLLSGEQQAASSFRRGNQSRTLRRGPQHPVWSQPGKLRLFSN